MAEPRTTAERKRDALALLEARHADTWVASASPDGRAHLVPLSFAWDGALVTLACEASSATACNIVDSGLARLAFGQTRNVVMMDAWLEEATAVADAPEVGAAYAAQADWDPRTAAGRDFLFLRLRPQRLQAWREVDEIAGRTIMRGGAWLA